MALKAGNQRDDFGLAQSGVRENMALGKGLLA